ncbi:GNAT family N-acetyltransferase [Peribacillus simplex]|uniref:GNAT family N-acetyltransferase n=1 Tax=Peribacillus simplex TaxID=1478 RepID=UPI002E244E06|nr:GNAT family N-acetyltransferase [Peribacillus simplex]MED4094094.1 GNAT family N-acetyltransferase [Peribacillus simplex]
MIEAYEHSPKYNAYYVCLLDDTELIGWVLIDKGYDFLNGNQVGCISDLYVKAQYRGNGYAKLLMEEAFNEFIMIHQILIMEVNL